MLWPLGPALGWPPRQGMSSTGPEPTAGSLRCSQWLTSGQLGDPNPELAAGNFLPQGLPRTEPGPGPGPSPLRSVGVPEPSGPSLLDLKSLFQMAAWVWPWGGSSVEKMGSAQPLLPGPPPASSFPPGLLSRRTLFHQARAVGQAGGLGLGKGRMCPPTWEGGLCALRTLSS